MKSLLSAPRLSLLLALTALPLGACAAVPQDSGDEPTPDRPAEHVGEAEDALTPYQHDTQISGQESQRAPTLAAYDYSVVMVHAGRTNNNLYQSTYDANLTWSTNTQIPNQTSKAPVALTQYGSLLHMAYLCGTSSNICYSTYDGDTWLRPGDPAYVSETAPALAHEPIHNKLMIVYGADPYGGPIFYAFNDGSNWYPPNAYPEGQGLVTATKTPALAVHNGRVHMVFESGSALWHTSFNGTTWDPRMPLSKFEQSSPSLTSYGGLLYLFHRSSSSNNNIVWASSPDGINNWTADVSLTSVVTQDSPSVASTGLLLVMGHKGNGNSNLFYETFQP